MAKTEIPEKYLVKPVGGKNSDAVSLFAVDAKEAVAGGTHEYVTQPKGTGADWLPEAKKEKPAKKVVEETEETEEEESEESEVATAKEIKSMNTAELEAYVEEHEIEIEGFEDMNLKDKRAALVLAVEGE